MVDFDKLLAERAKKKDADTIRREAEANNQALNERNSSRDDRFWKLTVKDRKGEAVIRFLPPQNETKSIIRRDMYFVETNYGKFGCLAPESAGVKSFPREVATKCWQEFKKTNNEEWKNLFKKRVAKTRYVANILVIDDRANPENNGKVFLMDISPQVYGIIMEASGVEVDKKKTDDGSLSLLSKKQEAKREPFDPFDLWKGANFNFIATPGQGSFHQYSQSFFDPCTELYDGDVEKLRELYAHTYSLEELLNQDNYEDYESLKQRYIEETGDYYILFPEERNLVEATASTRAPSVNDRLGLTAAAATAYSALDAEIESSSSHHEDEKSIRPTESASSTTEDEINGVLASLGIE